MLKNKDNPVVKFRNRLDSTIASWKENRKTNWNEIGGMALDNTSQLPPHTEAVAGSQL